MALTDVLRSASNSLSTQSSVLSTVSRNITGLNNPDYVRRDVEITSDTLFNTRVHVSRQVDLAIFSASLQAKSNLSKSSAIADGLNHLTMIQDNIEFSSTASGKLGELRQDLEMAAANPSNEAMLSQAVNGARDFAQTLNLNYQEILNLRTRTDAAISKGIVDLTELLSRFEEVNDAVVSATLAGENDFVSEDIRDSLAGEISEKLGVSIIRRDNKDMMLVASNGAILFDRKPRTISFEPNVNYGPLTTGNSILIDGVPISGSSGSGHQASSGELVGLVTLRDDILYSQQVHLDEIARAAIEVFAETDQSGGGKPAMAGLFTWSGGPNVPASATLESGIAQSIKVNPLVDPSAGGAVSKLRDGGISGDPDYVYNTTNSSGFADRIFDLAAAIDANVSFAAESGLASATSLSSFASKSLDDLHLYRQEILTRSEFQSELSINIDRTLIEENGPNLDFEMATMLQIERAYQATAKVLQTVDTLLGNLMEAV